jgi:SAM-dependent methyltransferase
MSIVDSFFIQRYHQQRIREFGAGSCRSLGWKTREGQEARFKILLEIGDVNNASVLDAGCGHGDLRAFLDEKYTRLRYIGIDQETSFLDVAIQKYGHVPGTSFFHGDFTQAELPVMDYILASGALNYRHSDPDFIFKAITKLFHSCRIGFGFNLLSRVEDPDGLLVAYQPQLIVEHCRTLSSQVELKEGYYDDDYTVFMNA